MRQQNTNRSTRIAEQIRRVLAQILTQDIRDNRLQLVSITAVHISPDLSVARAFVTSLDQASARDEMIDALNHAAGFMRSRLSQSLNIRRTPTLTFVYDESVEYGSRMSALIDKAISK